MLDRRARAAIAIGCILFLTYFVTTFYIDNGNQSEVEQYGSALVQAFTNHTVATDSDGRYSVLAELTFAPAARVIGALGSGAAITRAFLVERLAQALALFALAYVYYALLRLSWYARLVGLMLLAVCVAYASLARGWEFDKLDEAILFLLAAIALLKRWFWPLVPLAVLAALNRETGILLPFLYLAWEWPNRRTPAVGFCLAVLLVLGLAIVIPLEMATHGWRLDSLTIAHNLRYSDFSYATSGLVFLPLLALAWVRQAPAVLRRAFWVLAPAWLALAVLSEQLRNGPLLLAPVALLFVPIVIWAVQSGASTQRSLSPMLSR